MQKKIGTQSCFSLIRAEIWYLAGGDFSVYTVSRSSLANVLSLYKQNLMGYRISRLCSSVSKLNKNLIEATTNSRSTTKKVRKEDKSWSKIRFSSALMFPLICFIIWVNTSLYIRAFYPTHIEIIVVMHVIALVSFFV